jgi:hypothetical protein
MDNLETLTTGGRQIKTQKNNNTPTKKMSNNSKHIHTFNSRSSLARVNLV